MNKSLEIRTAMQSVPTPHSTFSKVTYSSEPGSPYYLVNATDLPSPRELLHSHTPDSCTEDEEDEEPIILSAAELADIDLQVEYMLANDLEYQTSNSAQVQVEKDAAEIRALREELRVDLEVRHEKEERLRVKTEKLVEDINHLRSQMKRRQENDERLAKEEEEVYLREKKKYRAKRREYRRQTKQEVVENMPDAGFYDM